MSTRTVPVQVNNEYIKGAGVPVGAAGSHNDVVLEISFSALWDGLAKKITWLDAKGENPTLTILTTDMLKTGETSVYLVKIPAEPKAYAGDMTMTIKGATVSGGVETRATLSTSCTFRVLPSSYDSSADESGDVTPTQAEQLQAEIDDILETISAAEASATAAAASETAASGSATLATEAKTAAEAAQAAAEAAQTAAETAQAGAEAAQSAAETAEGTATIKATEAGESAAAALVSKNTAAGSAATAVDSAATAVGAAADAQTAQEAAEDAQSKAEASAASAAGSATAAAGSATAAAGSATAAAGSATAAAGSATAAAGSATAAAGSATAAAGSAEEAADIAENAGFYTFAINADGHLILTAKSAESANDFSIGSDGHIYHTVNGVPVDLGDPTGHSVRYDGVQTLTDAQQAQARKNINAEKSKGVYELIETITLTEDTASIVRTREPDGTLYAFKAIGVVVQAKVGSVNSGIAVIGNYNSTRLQLGFINGIISNTTKKYGYAQIYQDLGVWTANGSTAVGGFDWTVSQMTGYSPAQAFSVKESENPYCNQVTLKVNASGATIPTGTIIQIYGVRA